MAFGWWLLLSIALLVTAFAVFLGWRARRKSAAGINTSMSVRASQLTGLAGRVLFRRMWLRMRMVVASRRRKKQLREAYQLKSAEEAAALMGNMKGVFMKLGQIVSFANDALPESARQALQGLQKDAPPMGWEVAREVVEEQLGGDLSQHFARVDEEPLAAASIGQVHRAKLRDGTEVVLKIQYPGVDTAIEKDLKFTGGLAAMVGGLYPNSDAKAIVEELRQRLTEEVDYQREAQNQQLFWKLWQGHPLIRVPRVYPDLSRKKVLVQQFVRGLGYYDFLQAANDAERTRAVFVLNDFVFDSLHRFHVFNGDPHPGNYLFHEDGGITFLDFGCIRFFEAPFMQELQGFNRAIVNQDRDAFDASMHRLQLILPGKPYDRDFCWEFFQYHAAPFAHDREFTFTEEYLAQAREVMNPIKLRKLNLPPELVFFNRITFGLNAIFEQLGASANWQRIYRRYLFPDEQAPPSLALTGVELPERFLSADQHPISRDGLTAFVKGGRVEPKETL